MPRALLLIDVQRNMLEPPAPVADAAAVGQAIAARLKLARNAGDLIVHIRNNGGPRDPDAPGTPGWELVHKPLAGEAVVDKTQPDSFAGTGLADLLDTRQPLTIVGMQSEYCIRSTALEALNRGHPVTLIHGAHSTYDADVPAATISARIEQELQGKGALIE